MGADVGTGVGETVGADVCMLELVSSGWCELVGAVGVGLHVLRERSPIFIIMRRSLSKVGNGNGLVPMSEMLSADAIGCTEMVLYSTTCSRTK